MVDMAKRFGIHPPKTTMKVIKAGKQHLDLLASCPEGRHSTVNVNHIVSHGALGHVYIYMCVITYMYISRAV